MPLARAFLVLFLTAGLAIQAAPAAAATPEQEQFQARLSAGVARLGFLVGDWTVVQSHPGASGWIERPPIGAIFKPSMNGLYVVGDFDSGAYAYQMVFSFDAAKNVYRIASRDDVSGLIDVYEGDFDSAGLLKLENLTSGTHYLVGGVRHHNRMTFTARPDGWTVLVEVTRDQGVSWQPQVRADARRKP